MIKTLKQLAFFIGLMAVLIACGCVGDSLNSNPPEDVQSISTINLIIILVIALLTYYAEKFADRMLKNYIPKVAGKVEMELDATVIVMIRKVVSASIYILGLMLIILQIPPLHSRVMVMLASAGLAGLVFKVS